MDKYVIKRADIEAMEGVSKQHFLNPNARRTSKSLGDLTGITGFGFHIVEVPPECESTEYHLHKFEDECVYILSGTAEVTIGEAVFQVYRRRFYRLSCWRAGSYHEKYWKWELDYALLLDNAWITTWLIIQERLSVFLETWESHGA